MCMGPVCLISTLFSAGILGFFSLKSKTKRKSKTTNIDKILGPLPFLLSLTNAFQKHFVVFQNWLFQVYHNFFFDWWVDVSNYWKHLMSSEKSSQKSIWIVWSSPRGLGISCELMRPHFSSMLLKNNKRTCLLQCSLPSVKGFDKVKLAPRKKMVTMLLFVTIAISAQRAEGHRRVSPVSNQ